MQLDKQTIELFKQTLQKDGSIDLPSKGNSMYPFIHSGDLCRFIPCKPEELKKGDVVLYYTASGDLIAHRFIEMRIINYMNYYFFKGDTNLSIDPPVKGYQVIGKLASIQKENKSVRAGDFIADHWGRMILTCPIISAMLQKYLSWKRQVQF
jgi:signal peptidase I